MQVRGLPRQLTRGAALAAASCPQQRSGALPRRACGRRLAGDAVSMGSEPGAALAAGAAARLVSGSGGGGRGDARRLSDVGQGQAGRPATLRGLWAVSESTTGRILTMLMARGRISPVPSLRRRGSGTRRPGAVPTPNACPGAAGPVLVQTYVRRRTFCSSVSGPGEGLAALQGQLVVRPQRLPAEVVLDLSLVSRPVSASSLSMAIMIGSQSSYPHSRSRRRGSGTAV